MGIGNKLVQLLEANKTNANELAKKIDVSPQTIYSIIKRDSKKADIEVLLKIADVFGVSAEYFVYDVLPDSQAGASCDFSPLEYEHIKKYRKLDTHGKDMVDTVLQKEYDRVIEISGHDFSEIPYTAEEIMKAYMPHPEDEGKGQAG